MLTYSQQIGKANECLFAKQKGLQNIFRNTAQYCTALHTNKTLIYISSFSTRYIGRTRLFKS